MQFNICIRIRVRVHVRLVCMHVHAYIRNAPMCNVECAKFACVCVCVCKVGKKSLATLGPDSDTLQVLFTGLLTELSLTAAAPSLRPSLPLHNL